MTIWSSKRRWLNPQRRDAPHAPGAFSDRTAVSLQGARSVLARLGGGAKGRPGDRPGNGDVAAGSRLLAGIERPRTRRARVEAGVEMSGPSGLRFRNVEAAAEDPVEMWPFEVILAAIERGTLPDWRRLAQAIVADPVGTGGETGRSGARHLPAVWDRRAAGVGDRQRPGRCGRVRTCGRRRGDPPPAGRLGPQPEDLRRADRHVDDPPVHLPVGCRVALGGPPRPDAARGGAASSLAPSRTRKKRPGGDGGQRPDPKRQWEAIDERFSKDADERRAALQAAFILTWASPGQAPEGRNGCRRLGRSLV